MPGAGGCGAPADTVCVLLLVSGLLLTRSVRRSHAGLHANVARVQRANHAYGLEGSLRTCTRSAASCAARTRPCATIPARSSAAPSAQAWQAHSSAHAALTAAQRATLLLRAMGHMRRWPQDLGRFAG